MERREVEVRREMVDAVRRAERDLARFNAGELELDDDAEYAVYDRLTMWTMDAPVLNLLDHTAPDSYGIDMPERLMWEASQKTAVCRIIIGAPQNF